jgi:hypothetical protein
MDMRKIGWELFIIRVHVMYIQAFTFIGIDLQGAISMLGASWMAVFVIRKLQKR